MNSKAIFLQTSPKGFLVSKSADYLHFKSQVITKSYFNMKGIDSLVKILCVFFFKILCLDKEGRKKEGQEI